MGRRELVRKLEKARHDFCGIGTRAVKLRLNRIGRTNVLARAFRIALEIEDCSTQAKKYGRSEWADWKYFEKGEKIHDLIKIFEREGWLFGFHKSNSFETRHIIS